MLQLNLFYFVNMPFHATVERFFKQFMCPLQLSRDWSTSSSLNFPFLQKEPTTLPTLYLLYSEIIIHLSSSKSVFHAENFNNPDLSILF